MRLVATLGLLAVAGPAPSAQAEPNRIAEFPVPSEPPSMGEIAAGPDGNLWFTEERKAIGRITPEGRITEFPIDSPGTPSAIVAGPDGNLWFTEVYPGGIGRIGPSGQFTNFPLAGVNEPGGIVPGPDGNMWFAADSYIGRIAPSGDITRFPLPDDQLANVNVPPTAAKRKIAAGPDGNLWFTEISIPGEPAPKGGIGRIAPGGEITEFPLAPSTYGQAFFAGPDGSLWLSFTQGGLYKGIFIGTSHIGTVSPSGQITEQFHQYPGVDLGDAAVGSDGNLWVAHGNIARLTPAGEFTEFEPPFGDSAEGIAAGPDGNLWFTGTRLAEHRVRSIVGRIPPNLLEVQLKGEWWNRKVSRTQRQIAAELACVGGTPESVCRGTLRLTTEGSAKSESSPAGTVVLGRRPYRLRAGSEHEFALRVSKKALEMRLEHTNLRNVRITATVRGGQDTGHTLVLQRPPHDQRHRGHSPKQSRPVRGWGT